MALLKGKALLEALATSLSLIVFFLFSSCAVDAQGLENDLTFVNYVYGKKQEKKTNGHFVLKESSNNEYLISLIKQFDSYTKNRDVAAIDSLKNSYRLKDNGFIETIFNVNEYKTLLSQRHRGNWDDKEFRQFLYPQTKSKSNIYDLSIGKPIYTSDDKKALVQVQTSTSYYVLIFEKVDNVWVERELIFPLFF